MTAKDFLLNPIPLLPARSELYPLQPLGLGTPLIESMTGYISRLAKEHRVSTNTLIKHVIAPKLSEKWSSFREATLALINNYYLVSANSTSESAKRIVEVLERLTLRNDLKLLTMLPWANSLSSKHLMRSTTAWCPSCYEDWRKAGSKIYEPLLWSIEAVTYCHIHRSELALICPFCKGQVHFLRCKLAPGYCAKCHKWLGRTLKDDAGVPVKDTAYVYGEENLTNSICELLLAAQQPDRYPREEVVHKSLSMLIDLTCNGNISHFSEISGLNYVSIRSWLNEEKLLTLEKLLKVAKATGQTALRIIAGDLNLKDIPYEVYRSGRKERPRRSRKQFDWSNERKILERALRESPPPQLKEVIRRIYSGPDYRLFYIRIRNHFPKLCKAISKRYVDFKKKMDEKELRELFMAELRKRETPPPSLEEVFRRIAKHRKWVSVAHSQLLPIDVCNKIRERYNKYKIEQRGMKKEIRIQSIRKAVMALHKEGIYPTARKIRSRFGFSIYWTELDVFYSIRAELGYVKRSAVLS